MPKIAARTVLAAIGRFELPINAPWKLRPHVNAFPLARENNSENGSTETLSETIAFLRRSALLRMCFKAALHDRQTALTDSPFPRGCAPADERPYRGRSGPHTPVGANPFHDLD
jgi:hypothetical protein